LASFALAGDTKSGRKKLTALTQSRRTQRLTLDSPLPLYFLYWTALVTQDGHVEFRPDRYGRDVSLVAALTATDIKASMHDAMSSAESQDSPPADDELSP